MEHVTDDILVGIIEELGEEFDSHDVIEKLMHNYTWEYVRELNLSNHPEDPIKDVHATIGRQLLTFTDLIVQTGKVKSLNCRRQITENEQWRKL